jgi:D-erythrulose 1-phosphate 3-epimerase
MDVGVNLCFAIKRWPEPEQWARIVADELGVASVQFTMDLIDPWWPADLRAAMAARARSEAAARGIAIHSVQIGLAGYTYNGLLHPDAAARGIAEDWWRRSIDMAAELGARAVGGPVGALSVADAAAPERRAALYAEVVERLGHLAAHAAEAGLEALLVEPTPLPREIPSTVAEARQLVADTSGGAVPILFVLDVGHALYRPLYGEDASLVPWLSELGDSIGVLHLQNHDYRADAHWGWPDPRGAYDPAGFFREVRDAGLEDVPVFIEVFSPFEQADDEILPLIRSSLAACRG